MPLVDLKYVTTGSWGTGLARPLTAVEADTNIDVLRLSIQDIIDNPIEGVSVTNIVVTGREVTFYMSDATTYGPFLLPVVYPRYRGTWTALASYAVYDIITEAEYGTFMVAVDHTAAATFDPTASNSEGDYYVQISPPSAAAYLNTSSATLTLDATHAGRYIRCSNAGGTTVTLPSGIFDDNTEIHFRQTSTGAVTIVPGDTGVTINTPTGYDAGTEALGDTITIKHITADEWDAFGNLASVSA